MARASTRIIERLAVQAQQPRVPAPAPMPRTSVPQQSSRPNGAPARPAPAPGQGRELRPAVTSTPPSNGKLTLGAAVPPDVAARIAQVRAAAKPAPAPKAVVGGGSTAQRILGCDPEQPRPARSEATPVKPKHEGPHPIERLAALYPAIFDFHVPKPLAIGVNQQIAVALGIHPRAARAALARWTGRMNYLGATAAPGSRRFNLDGSDAGEVSDDHRAHAAETLAQKQAATLAPDMPAAMAVGTR